MNRYPADALSADLKAQITSDIQHLIEDSQIGSSVVIRTPTGVAFNPATGSSVLTQAQNTITGTLQALTQREIAGSGGLYQEGDRMLRVLASRLSTAATTDTQVVSGSDTYQVISTELDALGIHFVLVLRINP